MCGCHWKRRILWLTNFLQTGQWSTLCAQSQQSKWPHCSAVFLGSVRHIAQYGWDPAPEGDSLTPTLSGSETWTKLSPEQNDQSNLLILSNHLPKPVLFSMRDRHSKQTFSLLQHADLKVCTSTVLQEKNTYIPWQYIWPQGYNVTEASSSLHITHTCFSIETDFTCFCRHMQKMKSPGNIVYIRSILSH